MGYAQSGLRSGATLVTPQFLGLGTDSDIDLQDIKCRDEDSDLVVLNVLDEVGLVVANYFWINYGGEGGDESCWVDDNYEKVENVKFAPGQAFWVEGDSTENMFQSAGLVGTSDVAIQLQSGATTCGNCSPVQIDLQDVTCRDDDSDLVVLNVLDEVGLVVANYFWINYGGEGGDESCWVDDNYEKVENIKFAPGQAFWIEGDSDENVITFPGVDL